MNTAAPATVYQCPDCDWTGTLDDINGLHHLHHIHERISPGELVPAGACPECGAMIEVEDADVPDYTLAVVAHIMRARGWAVTEPAAPAPALAPAPAPADGALHEYAFDCALACAIRVNAHSEPAARDLLREQLDAADANLGAWPDGKPILCEVSLLLGGTIHVPPSLYEIDGEPV